MYDRPDLAVRFFVDKRRQLFTMLEGKGKGKDKRMGWLGEVIGHMSSTEFQKRSGMPHQHIIFIMQETKKSHTPEYVDQYISAELPDRGEDGSQERELYNLVLQLMLHTCTKKSN